MIAVPVAVPMYLNVYCGKAAWKRGWMTFCISPESLTSLVPTTVKDDALSARAIVGARNSMAAATNGVAAISRPLTT